MAKKVNTVYRPPIEEEHDIIANYLQSYFIPFLNDQKMSKQEGEKKYLIKLMETLCSCSWGNTQEEISEKVGLGRRGEVSSGSEELNKHLKIFCKSEGFKTPIQIFYHHVNEQDKIKRIKCHLACSSGCIKQEGTKEIYCSYEVIPFTMARGIDKRVEQFLSKLKEEAQRHLDKKLQGQGLKDYQSLGLEIGVDTSDENEPSHLSFYLKPSKRKWKKFDQAELKHREGIYILSCETGAGKTTFLRQLQCTLIKEGDVIPIFLEASEIEAMHFKEGNRDSFIQAMAEVFCGYLSGGLEGAFFKANWDRIVFLVDGLDQIKGVGTEYLAIINRLFSIIDKRLILSSRPFAVLDLGEKFDFSSLRLQPFDQNHLKAYFGIWYEQARQVCKGSPELLVNPLFASMIRGLIQDGYHQDITSRTELYEAFINSAFEDSKRKVRLSTDALTRARMRFGEISCKAIGSTPSYLQSIPLEFVAQCHDNVVKVDYLFKIGIVEHIKEGSRYKHSEYLYFHHASVQEYLAAEYIYKSKDRVDFVIEEKWHPKWKEVLKFIAGHESNQLVETILSEPDNLIHSKLFLSAELLACRNESPKLKESIVHQLFTLINNPLFSMHAEICLAQVDNDAVRQLFYSRINQGEVWNAAFSIYVLVEWSDGIGDDVVQFIHTQLDDAETRHDTVKTVLSVLGMWVSKTDFSIMKRLIDKLNDPDDEIVSLAGHAIERNNTDLNEDLLKEIISLLDSDDSQRVIASLHIIELLDGLVSDSALESIMRLVKHTDAEIVQAAISTLAALASCHNVAIARLIASQLEHDNRLVVYTALCALGEMPETLESSTVIAIIKCIKHPEHTIVNRASQTIDKLVGQLDDEVVDELAQSSTKKLSDKEREILKVLSKRFQSVTQDEYLQQLIDRLDNGDYMARYHTLQSILTEFETLDTGILKKVAGQLQIEEADDVLKKLTLQTLARFSQEPDEEIIQQVTEILDDEELYEDAIVLLCQYGATVDESLTIRLINELESEDVHTVCTALKGLTYLQVNIENKALLKIRTFLEHCDHRVVESAIAALGRRDITSVNLIAKKLDDPDNRIVAAAKKTLLNMTDHIDSKILEKLVALGDVSIYGALLDMYSQGKLESLS